MERDPTSSIDEFYWSFIYRTFNTSKLFFRTFNTSKLFFMTFNTSKVFFRIFQKCRVLKLQALLWKDKDEAVPEGLPRAAPVIKTAAGEPLGLGNRALRRRDITLGEGQMPSIFKVEMHGGLIRDHTVRLRELSPTCFDRPVLALEAWARHVDTRMTDISRAGYDDHRLVHYMLLQQATLQPEQQEMRGHVTALEQESDRRERWPWFVVLAVAHDGTNGRS
uniref:Uncharacterized protein n=1 Tax=Tanacetum cinerariifolium TaxID=118510 RepID=A0A6L2JQ17_TANCI|nr:hypothetical protein [Tanacetum cinerariifolium]